MAFTTVHIFILRKAIVFHFVYMYTRKIKCDILFDLKRKLEDVNSSFT